MSGSSYFKQQRPQYATTDASTFLSARLTAKGNGSSDDSFGLGLIFALGAAVNRPVYIPVGAKSFGECWA
ncbi:hypothetical protein LX32DRAFT_728300 [Colletotrichum zoysiae]|uniref:Uncharacterized protein n=1 Tax=Colletotrichum zoysiae TaxID=1216348 RepID=A0AAD9M587_9PEZI|nr:hypothetical protein LX32DRAFT_728300 [Colletotrichum zoysiae]